MLQFIIPKFEELRFREQLLQDPDTMSYNEKWGGSVSFPEEKWGKWYDWWISHPGEQRFYRYILDAKGTFVGEIAYHYDSERRIYHANVIVQARFRGQGYGWAALQYLCACAKQNGLTELYDEIAQDNPAISLFLKQGFVEVSRTEESILLRKVL